MTDGIPAPELDEVAQVWWDDEVIPRVVWTPDARVFALVHPDRDDLRLHLLTWPAGAAAPDPIAIATVLAEGMAACDFPPSAERADPARVRDALRVAGVVLPDA